MSRRMGGWGGNGVFLQGATLLQWECDTDTYAFPAGSTAIAGNYTGSTPSAVIPTQQLYLWYQGNYSKGYPDDTSLYANIHFTLSQPLNVVKKSS